MTRMENGKTINEGLCLQWAKELGIGPVNELMEKMGITDEELMTMVSEAEREGELDEHESQLIRAAIDAGIRVVGVPGCCAAVTALSISGFDLSTFFFFGFFPREAADRRRALAMMRRGDTRTYCFYESPKRIMDAVEFFISEHAGVRLCLCNDMTKLHEMTFRGTPAEVRDQLLAKGSYDKGEYVLLCEVEEDYLITEVEHVSSPEALLVDCMVQHDCTAKDAIKLLLKDDNNTYSKNELYAAHLALKERFGA